MKSVDLWRNLYASLSYFVVHVYDIVVKTVHVHYLICWWARVFLSAFAAEQAQKREEGLACWCASTHGIISYQATTVAAAAAAAGDASRDTGVMDFLLLQSSTQSPPSPLTTFRVAAMGAMVFSTLWTTVTIFPSIYGEKYPFGILLRTRCSAIAERPRCRVRYSFRQK